MANIDPTFWRPRSDGTSLGGGCNTSWFFGNNLLRIFTKAAFDRGVSTYVFIFYRQVLGTLILASIAFTFERKRVPRLSFSIWFKSFLLALFGITAALNAHTIGISYTSPTLGSAIVNTTPVITFVLATFFRMESVKMKKLWGMAKIFGVALCVGGVAVIAFYTGPYLRPFNHHLLSRGVNNHVDNSTTHPSMKWMLGTLLMIITNTTWATWLILHGPLLKEYPSKLVFMVFQCLFSTMQTLVIAVIMERDRSRWNIGYGMGLVGVAYCGIFVTAISFYLQSWCVEKKGPVFLAMSTPLTLIITIFCSAFLFGEVVNLGRILGGVLLVGGLYSVLWGKNRENQEKTIPVVEGDNKTCLNEMETARELDDKEENVEINIKALHIP